MENNMKYVIQDNLTSQLEEIKPAIAKHNLPCVYVKIIPFTTDIICDEPLEGIDYLPYGSTSLTNITHKLGWKGQYFNPDTFNTEVWLDNRDDMLNTMYPIAILDAIPWLRKQKPDSEWFIRPAEDLKSFSGQVIEAFKCAEWLEGAMECASSGVSQLMPDTYVSISHPKHIQAEFRWFVVGGQVISGSMYHLHGRLVKQRVTDDKMTKEAQELADKWLPMPCCVMDLALVDDVVKVVEFNTINSTGFYDHDVEKILVELYKYASNH
jgi:hypothetical protein